MNNLEALLADHNSVLFDALDCDCCVYHSGEKVCIYNFDMCERGMREWLLAEHVDAQQDANGTCPDGNGTCPNDEPCTSEAEKVQGCTGDSVAIMRDLRGCVDMTMLKNRLCHETGTHDLVSALETLADMVERDYVSRMDYEDAAELCGKYADTIDMLTSRCTKLETERDELKAFSERLETAAHDKLGVTLFGVDYVTEEFMLHVRDTLTAERDELTDKIGEITNEASELMKKQPYTFDVHDVPGSLQTVGRYIDELTAERDEWKAKAEAKSAKRAAAVERLNHSWNAGIRDTRQLFGSLVGGGAPTYAERNDYDALIDLLTDDDANDDLAPFSNVSADDVDANDMNARVTTMPLKMPSEIKVQYVCDESCNQVADQGEHTETPPASKWRLNEAQSDSREKLEADALSFANGFIRKHNGAISWNDELYRGIIELLDRQAAITSKDWCWTNDAFQEQVTMLTEQRDHYIELFHEQEHAVYELTNQLESAHAKNRSLKTHIAKMQEGRHGWHIKGKELQRQVDSLKRKLEAAQDVNERQDLEYVSLVHEIGTLRAERDRYRDLCGKLLDAADDMRRVRDAFDQFGKVD